MYIMNSNNYCWIIVILMILVCRIVSQEKFDIKGILFSPDTFT